MKFIILTFIATLIFFTSCEKDAPIIPNEEELITTLLYKLTPVGVGKVLEFQFEDLDGDGGDEPVIINATLSENKTYTGEIILYNEQSNPVDNITEEVEEEAISHQFFFQTTVTGLSIIYNDTDIDGNPVGLSTKLSTTAPNSGTLTIILRHTPNKSAPNVANGDITNAGGETDISVTFTVSIE